MPSRACGHGIDRRRLHEQLRLACGGCDQNEECVEARCHGKRHNQAHARECQSVQANLFSLVAWSSHR